MPRIEFGAVAMCRRCGGRGEVRHQKDDNAAKERARMRRHGHAIDAPESMDPCPVCRGLGVLPVSVVDKPVAG